MFYLNHLAILLGRDFRENETKDIKKIFFYVLSPSVRLLAGKKFIKSFNSIAVVKKAF